MSELNGNKWPKTYRDLTEEEMRIKDDFMHYWHEVLPRKFGIVEVFNHNYPVRKFEKLYISRRRWKTLEIGGGIGSHIPFEEKFAHQEYGVLELRDNMLSDLKRKYPNVHGVLGDAQKPYGENEYDRIIAIHVLEHLPNLPEAVKCMKMALKPDGVAHVVIPCEGSLAYTIARKISAERIFKKRYKRSYDFFIKTEHVNNAGEIMEELGKCFIIKSI